MCGIVCEWNVVLYVIFGVLLCMLLNRLFSTWFHVSYCVRCIVCVVFCWWYYAPSIARSKARTIVCSIECVMCLCVVICSCVVMCLCVRVYVCLWVCAMEIKLILCIKLIFYFDFSNVRLRLVLCLSLCVFKFYSLQYKFRTVKFLFRRNIFWLWSTTKCTNCTTCTL